MVIWSIYLLFPYYIYISSSRSRGTVSSSYVKTAEDSYDDTDSSIKTASDLDADVHDGSKAASIAEEIHREDESYSMSFDESFTDEESFRQVLPSESHLKEMRRQSSGAGGVGSADGKLPSLHSISAVI